MSEDDLEIRNFATFDEYFQVTGSITKIINFHFFLHGNSRFIVEIYLTNRFVYHTSRNNFSLPFLYLILFLVNSMFTNLVDRQLAAVIAPEQTLIALQ